ncbi:hypothetical protein NEF87_004548 [Candidatus Lokiarchaeum ossiferum]|uniref:Uncharacterized protein n=1 Tax=Candidatus Lokiarchaeum ossiferum TaxID=2951803 RepID=A0ABY6HXK9_9ARCH|nr:hypothetical protein NEF87_004548 [Candidatus Lokiarchaeum sp. B-35]
MIPTPDKLLIKQNIQKYRSLDWPDDDLIEKVMMDLGIHDNVEFEFCLKNRIKREREAAIKMLEKYLDDLTSGDATLWTEAKDTLKQIYYKIAEIDEEAML